MTGLWDLTKSIVVSTTVPGTTSYTLQVVLQSEPASVQIYTVPLAMQDVTAFLFDRLGYASHALTELPNGCQQAVAQVLDSHGGNETGGKAHPPKTNPPPTPSWMFGLWSFRFPPVLVRTGRRLPVQTHVRLFGIAIPLETSREMYSRVKRLQNAMFQSCVGT